jgi:CO/xanthine dehydrogenase Mo-binding subunit
MGQGARTVMARLAAASLELPLERIVVIDPDTTRTPFDATSSSSRTTYQHARAIEIAAQRMRDSIEEVATVVSRGVPRLSYAAGRVASAGGDFDMDFSELLRASGRDELTADGEFVNEQQRAPETGTRELTSQWHQGAVAIEVAVDIETGRVSVERACGAAWAGRVISVPGARLQNDGNIIYGLGPALFEEVEFDQGVPISTSLRDYRIPSLRDLPADLRTVALVHDQDEPAYPDGLGESLIPAVAPAVANALADATGIRIRELPLSPERVLSALDDAADERV